MYVKLRPNLREFLEDMEKRYELIVYTAASSDYADNVVNYIENKAKKRPLFTHILYGTQCIKMQGLCVFKYLNVLCEGREIKNIVIVDNTVRNYALSIRNGIPIRDFRGNENDQELVYLAKYLRMLAQEDDVRNRIKEDFAQYLLEHYNVG